MSIIGYIAKTIASGEGVRTGKVVSSWLRTSREEKEEVKRFLTEVYAIKDEGFPKQVITDNFATNYPILSGNQDILDALGEIIDQLITDEDAQVLLSQFIKP